ncbi:MAG: hypothetical protein Kow0020_15800 [Wenzhouxiangellaceae bacterium]
MNVDQIQALLEQTYPRAQVSVTTPDGVHFTAKVVTADFAGMSRIQRHRAVHAAIGPALGTDIHALSLTLRTPEEDAGAESP